MITRESSHQLEVSGVTPEAIWSVWSDVNHWHTWDADIEYAKLEMPFQAGSHFTLKPRKGPKVKIRIEEAVEPKSLTDMTSFPFARMYSRHEVRHTPDGLEVSHSVEMIERARNA